MRHCQQRFDMSCLQGHKLKGNAIENAFSSKEDLVFHVGIYVKHALWFCWETHDPLTYCSFNMTISVICFNHSTRINPPLPWCVTHSDWHSQQTGHVRYISVSGKYPYFRRASIFEDILSCSRLQTFKLE